jgi:hypothetical protein
MPDFLTSGKISPEGAVQDSASDGQVPRAPEAQAESTSQAPRESSPRAQESTPERLAPPEPDLNEHLLRSFGMTEQQLRETVNWARQAAEYIQSGRLRPVEEQSPEQSQLQQVFERWDELGPREQAQALVMASREALKQELRQIEQQLQSFQKNQAAQLQLAMRSIKLAQEAGVPFDEIIVEATKLASMSPDDLLQAALEAKVRPKKMQEEINKAVQAELAKRMQEQENQEAQSLLHQTGIPRWMRPKNKTENPLQEQMRRRLEILRALKKSA